MEKVFLKLIICTLTMFMIISCEPNEEKGLAGKWKTETSKYGSTIFLEITKEGNLFKCHKYVIDKNGQKRTGEYSGEDKFVGKLIDGKINAGPFSNINYSKESKKIYWEKWEFDKVE